MEAKQIAKSAWGQVLMLLVPIGLAGNGVRIALGSVAETAPKTEIGIWLILGSVALGTFIVIVYFKEKWVADEFKELGKQIEAKEKDRIAIDVAWIKAFQARLRELVGPQAVRDYGEKWPDVGVNRGEKQWKDKWAEEQRH